MKSFRVKIRLDYVAEFIARNCGQFNLNTVDYYINNDDGFCYVIIEITRK